MGPRLCSRLVPPILSPAVIWKALCTLSNKYCTCPEINGGPLPIHETSDTCDRDIEYTPPKGAYDPRCISAQTHVIVFLDAGADSADGTVDYILPEFQMVRPPCIPSHGHSPLHPQICETPFSPTDLTFPCSTHRTSGPLPTSSHMYLINHTLNVDIIPIGAGAIIRNPLEASTMNGITSCVPFRLSSFVFRPLSLTPQLLFVVSLSLTRTVVPNATTGLHKYTCTSCKLLGTYPCPYIIMSPTYWRSCLLPVLANTSAPRLPAFRDLSLLLVTRHGCAPLTGNHAPNFILLDFVDIRVAFQAAAILKNLW
jgi:hypothetical protein